MFSVFSVFSVVNLLFEVDLPLPTRAGRTPLEIAAMSFPPNFLYAKKRVHRKRTKPPAVPRVSVVSVTFFDDIQADFEFSRPVVLAAGPADWSMILIDDTPVGTQSASEGIQVSPTIVRFHFDDGGLAAGQPWRVTGPTPAKLDLHGAVLVVPESGIVIEE